MATAGTLGLFKRFMRARAQDLKRVVDKFITAKKQLLAAARRRSMQTPPKHNYDKCKIKCEVLKRIVLACRVRLDMLEQGLQGAPGA